MDDSMTRSCTQNACFNDRRWTSIVEQPLVKNHYHQNSN